ncbi:MAG: hypothetical protein IKI11_01285, partial [Neisseriaceae bacterium]|nr:hypothetical protein [Neisseriaceae bacterium]
NSNNNYILMNSIFELISERLKEKKCVFKINSPFSKNNYALTDIISIEKIDIFNDKCHAKLHNGYLTYKNFSYILNDLTGAL